MPQIKKARIKDQLKQDPDVALNEAPEILALNIYLQGDTIAMNKDNCHHYSVDNVIQHFVHAAHAAGVNEYTITVAKMDSEA